MFATILLPNSPVGLGYRCVDGDRWRVADREITFFTFQSQ
jgi:hypothetical protein